MRRLLPYALVLFGCGTTAFAPTFEERDDPEFSNVMSEIGSAPAREESAVVVAVTRDPNGLLAWDLRAGRRAWAIRTNVTATPIIAGNYVVAGEDGIAVVRRLSDGERVYAVGDRELRLVGAGGEGDRLVISLARGEGESPPGVVIGIEGGAGRWTQELAMSVAAPQVVGSVAIVPWAQQRVSFLDMAEGRERARLRIEDAVIGHVMRSRDAIILGQHELFAMTPQLAERGRRGDEFLRPQGRPLPGQPPLLADGYERRFAPDSARNRVRLEWALGDAEGEGLAFTDGVVYFVFYRMVFGLDAAADELRWVQTLPSDVVGAAAAPGGALVVTEDGTLRFLSAAGTGREVWNATLGARVQAAAVRMAAFSPEQSEGESEPLRVQLERAAALEDQRLDAGRALVFRYYARLPSEDVTAQLIRWCAERGVGGPARLAACEAVASRENGGSHVREALRARASFLNDIPPPPVGALARAAANMRLRDTVAALLTHLSDPATPAEELTGLFDGLARLGDARAIAPIENYLRLYHADAIEGRDVEALGAAAKALVTLSEERFSTVQDLAADPLASQGARDRMTRALTELLSARAAQEAPATPARTPHPQPEPPAADDRPDRITNEICSGVLQPVDARLRRCLERPGADPHPSARIMMTVDAEGHPQTVSVTPPALQECIEPLVRARTFPRTRRGSESIVHVIRR